MELLEGQSTYHIYMEALSKRVIGKRTTRSKQRELLRKTSIVSFG